MPVGLLVSLGLLLQLGFLPRLMFLHDVGSLLRLGEPRLHLSTIPIHYRIPSATRTPSLSKTKVAKNYPTRLLHILMHQMTVQNPY